MSNIRNGLLFLSIAFLGSCNWGTKSGRADISTAYFVTAQTETKPVPRDASSDAADDENGWLFVAEEDKGIWKFEAEPDGKASKSLLAHSAEKDNPFIQFDLEGWLFTNAPTGKDIL